VAHPDKAFAEERRAEIVKIVLARGRAHVDDLVSALGVSAPTIRKDLDALESRHQVRRTHGGVIGWAGSTEPDIRERANVNTAEKNAIGRAARSLIEPGDSIFLDSGTTVRAIALDLDTPRVNVLTNSIDVAVALADRATIRHTLVGGTYRSRGGSTVGPIALGQLQQFGVAKAFIGVTGLTDNGLWCADIAEAQLKRWIAEHTQTVIVVMDHTKVGAIDFASICNLGLVDTLVTDAPSDELRALCEAASTTLLIA
jgi:DeoR/GlpR family transcriptional regulator of sugar metabolism